jgi:ferritin-like metal-binding protein YciE
MPKPSSITKSPATLIAWANQLGMKEAAMLLNETLEEEYDADRTLTELAEGSLDRQAAA